MSETPRRYSGIAIDFTSCRMMCPFLSAFAELYVPHDVNVISTRDHHTEYKHFVISKTTDVRLIHIAENFRRFSIQFADFAVHMNFAKVSDGVKGYKLQRVGRNVQRTECFPPPIFSRPLEYNLRAYNTRRSVLNRKWKEDRTSTPTIEPVSTAIGNGVFATHDYTSGQEVCECFGQLVSKEEADIRQAEYERSGLSYRFIELEGGYGSSVFCLDCHRNFNGDRIDPDSNLGGNMNHSCNPNCKLVRKVKDGRSRFFLETTTAVSECAQFLINYNDNRSGAPSFVKNS